MIAEGPLCLGGQPPGTFSYSCRLRRSRMVLLEADFQRSLWCFTCPVALGSPPRAFHMLKGLLFVFHSRCSTTSLSSRRDGGGRLSFHNRASEARTCAVSPVALWTQIRKARSDRAIEPLSRRYSHGNRSVKTPTARFANILSLLKASVELFPEKNIAQTIVSLRHRESFSSHAEKFSKRM